MVESPQLLDWMAVTSTTTSVSFTPIPSGSVMQLELGSAQPSPKHEEHTRSSESMLAGTCCAALSVVLPQ